MHEFLSEFREFWWLGLIVLFVGFGLIKRVIYAIESVLLWRDVERSRREIAAYVAEGSMTPEEGERLIAAGAEKRKTSQRWCC